MNTLPDDVKEKKKALIKKHLAAYYRHKGKEISMDDILPMSRILPMMEEYAKAYAPVPSNEIYEDAGKILYPLELQQIIMDFHAWLESMIPHVKKSIQSQITEKIKDLEKYNYAAPVPGKEEMSFQNRVDEWMQVCFGTEISKDKIERNHRFIEEALELIQSLGATKCECQQLVDYVFDRDKGEPIQETGGVMVTLAALCLAQGMNMDAAAEIELKRIWTKVDKIREKQATKPKHSPLPASPSTASNEDKEIECQARLLNCECLYPKCECQPASQSSEPKAVQQAAEKYGLDKEDQYWSQAISMIEVADTDGNDYLQKYDELHKKLKSKFTITSNKNSIQQAHDKSTYE